jgi:hypothetical protein
MDDKCRSRNIVLVFNHWFEIDGSTQVPRTETGPFVVVTKGTNGVLIPLTDRRFRWYCGSADEALAGSPAGQIADQGGVEAQGKCIEALSDSGSNSLIATICNAVRDAVATVVQGLLGSWEAARCATGTTRVKLDYRDDGTLIWNCYGR